VRSREVFDLPQPKPVTGVDPLQQHQRRMAAIAEAVNFRD
jgi:hypothetical protein